jgi:formylglycine-generating enzyme required for sulfatase activity
VTQAGTASANRLCAACSAGQTTTTSNATACNTQYGVLNQSCTGLGKCRGSLMEACCQPLGVPTGTFTQGTNTGLSRDIPAHTATVSGYQLEEFEVTVGRFRKFVAAYVDNTAANAPPSGAGSNANVTVTSTGWNTAWNGSLPASQAALIADLKCDANASWTDTPGANESFPINCVSWFEAFAFCIWDGERLPTESEWEYATAGGSAQNPYPWGTSPAPSCTYANYQGCVGAVRGVGLASQDDSAQWNQYDLLGNAAEWTYDSYASYTSSAVTNYAYNNPSMSMDQRVVRGGGFNDTTMYILASARNFSAPSNRSSNVGVRCAH